MSISLPHSPASDSTRLARGRIARLALFALVATAATAADRSGKMNPDFEALAKKSFVKLPAPPEWAPAESAGVWTAEELKAAFARATDTPPAVNHVRSEFLLPGAEWVRRYRTWFSKLERPLRLRFEGEQWDCDNYANCFVTFADLLALRAGENRGTLAVGWATVFYRHPFAGIEAGGAHAVVVVATGEGLFVIEPQDGTTIRLESFPNRDTIEAVYF